MSIFRPTHWAGQSFIAFAIIILGFAAVIGILIGLEYVTGCAFNEGGSGECMIAGVNVMVPVSVIGLSTIVTGFLVVPVCLIGMIVTAAISLFTRRW